MSKSTKIPGLVLTVYEQAPVYLELPSGEQIKITLEAILLPNRRCKVRFEAPKSVVILRQDVKTRQ